MNKNILTLKVVHIGIMVRVNANGPGDLGSIPGRVIPKTQKCLFAELSVLYGKGKVE